MRRQRPVLRGQLIPRQALLPASRAGPLVRHLAPKDLAPKDLAPRDLAEARERDGPAVGARAICNK